MGSTPKNQVFFFLSAGWGPVVRTLPIVSRLVAHGMASSVAIGGTIGPELRAAGLDLIEISLPAFNVRPDEAGEWWSPYHFLAHHHSDIDSLLHHVEGYRKAISAGRPAV